MTDYKQLCAELHAALEKHDLSLADDRLLDRSAAALRAALAKPELEEPTDKKLDLLADCYMITDGETGAVSLEHLDYARAVLARWGTHPGSPDNSTPQPVPVSERLPGPNDCDAEGKCWAWKLDDEDDAWHLELWEWVNSPWTTHWLPFHALPQPS